MLNNIFFIHRVRREWTVQSRQWTYFLYSNLFFIMVSVFFPLGLPNEPNTLELIAPALYWFAALFAIILSSERLFSSERDNGVIAQWIVSGQPLVWFLWPKLIIHACLVCFPLLLITPLFVLLFHLNAFQGFVLAVGFLAGVPIIILLVAFASALSNSLGDRSMLVNLLVLPLAIPVQVFGSHLVLLAKNHMVILPLLGLMSGMSLLMIAVFPFIIAFVLRLGSSS